MGTTFGAIASEYIAKAEKEGRSPATVSKLHWAREWLEPALGRRPIDQIEPHEILAVLKGQEAKGQLETARRTRAFASRVFRYAVATTRAKADPAALLAGAIAAPRPKHMAAILEPARAGELLRAIQDYSGAPLTRLALMLSAHVFVRPGELRQAEWSEIDADAAVWRIPAERMKKRREHVVPLSRQSLAILEEARALSGGGRFVFPALGKPGKCLSENTANAALRRMGFGADEMSAHGFRAMASTFLNESGKWSPDAIAQTSHVPPHPLAYAGDSDGRTSGMEAIAVSINDAAKALGLGRTSIYAMIADGRLEAFRLGRRRLVTVESIRKLVAANRA